MASKLEELDPIPEPSLASFTEMTPQTEGTVIDDAWDGRAYAIPWPGNTYVIVEHGSNRAITLNNGRICLHDFDDESANNRWHCVEKQGYFGFYNLKSHVYLGHNGAENRVYARAKAHNNWEMITPRKHPDGGYQLLFPYFEHTLMLLSVADGNEKLVRTRHGETRWDFIKK
jgi:hypothetical protein